MRAVGLDRDLEAARVQRRRRASSSSCSSGSPPVQTTKRRAAAGRTGQRARDRGGESRRPSRTCRRRGRRCRRSRCRRTGRRRVARSLLAAGPQVAAGEAAEHRRPAGVGALALQRVEDLLDRVGHRRVRRSGSGAGSATPASAKPLSRSRHESHAPQARAVGVGVVAADASARSRRRARGRGWMISALRQVDQRRVDRAAAACPRRRPWWRGWPSRSKAAMYSGRQSG